MAQTQRPADFHQDELCPPNKIYALTDANKKVDLENLLCPDESRILANILQNHPLRFIIDASSSVPWIYFGQLWHTLQEDGSKSCRKSKGVVGMKIPDWMITDEMKLTENYQLYTEVFRVDVPTTQLHPIESTQGTHRKTRTPTTSNLKIDEGQSSAPRRSTVIRLRIPPRRSTRLTPPTLFPTTDEANDLVLQDTLQVSLAEQKSHEELEATQNVENFKEHLMAEEIEKLVEGKKNVEDNVEVASSPLRNDDNQTNLGTRLEPRSDKERPEVEKIANISQPVNIIKEEEESVEDDYELKL
ncbi:hypothetical protein Tco_1181447 [Tanacetum coccineum]